MKCVLCGGNEEKKIVEYKEFGISLGKFPASVCKTCGEAYFDSETAKKIQAKSKQVGLFGLIKKTKIAEVGNSWAVRIPKAIVEFMDLERGKEVTLIPKGKKELIVKI